MTTPSFEKGREPQNTAKDPDMIFKNVDMAKVTIYHNNRCSKSRCALALLEEKNIDYDIRYYLKNAPSPEELRTLLNKLGMKPEEIIRRNEKIFKTDYKGKDLSDEQWLTVLSEHPKLIQRPIVINGEKAVVGRPPEKIEEVL